LSGLDNMTSVGNNLNIQDNDGLTNLSGLEVTSLGGYLNIQDNDGLTSLSGLDNMTTVGGDLNIQDNDALTNLSGMDNMTYVGNNLNIKGNDGLLNLSGLDNMTYVGEQLFISYNDSLICLNSLFNVHLDGNYLSIDNNTGLSMDAAYALETQLINNGFTGTANINDNTGLPDSDGDCIGDDGDGSGAVGDNLCTGGNTTFCDDNCIDIPNPDQADCNGDGIGDACTPRVELHPVPIHGDVTVDSEAWTTEPSKDPLNPTTVRAGICSMLFVIEDDLCICSEVPTTTYTLCPYTPGVGQTGPCTDSNGIFFGVQHMFDFNSSVGVISFWHTSRNSYMLQVKGTDCMGQKIVSPSQDDYYYIKLVCGTDHCDAAYCAANPCY